MENDMGKSDLQSYRESPIQYERTPCRNLCEE